MTPCGAREPALRHWAAYWTHACVCVRELACVRALACVCALACHGQVHDEFNFPPTAPSRFDFDPELTTPAPPIAPSALDLPEDLERALRSLPILPFEDQEDPIATGLFGVGGLVTHTTHAGTAPPPHHCPRQSTTYPDIH
jgi:hypothetical protein